MLAKEVNSLGRNISGAKPWKDVPNGEVKRKIYYYVERTWQTQWSQKTSCRQTKTLLPKISSSVLKHNRLLSKEALNYGLQATTGHTLVGYHLHKWLPQKGTRCSQCEETEETSLHLLQDCPSIGMKRKELQNRLNYKNMTMLKYGSEFFRKTPALRNLLESNGQRTGDS